MSSQTHSKHDPLAWLLEKDEPGVRYLALRDLAGCGEADAELRSARREAHQQGPIAAVLAQMDESGYWVKPGSGYSPKYRSTVWALLLLAQLGARLEEDPRLERACAYLLDHALAKGGRFSYANPPAPSGALDCLQGNLCWSLLELGCADPRLEKAFDWLARSLTGEGIAPATERQAEERYTAYKCGPGFACGANDKLPCAWGGCKVMLALASLPAERRTPQIERALLQGAEFLLSVDPATAAYPAGYSDKPNRSWWKFGFPVFYVTDILQVVEALVAAGYGADPRLANALALIRSKQDSQGRWLLEYDYPDKTWVDFGPKKQPNKWVTLRALRALQVGVK